MLSSALRNMHLSVSAMSLLKFGHAYFTISTEESYTDKTNSQNDDKARKPTLGSHSIIAISLHTSTL